MKTKSEFDFSMLDAWGVSLAQKAIEANNGRDFGDAGYNKNTAMRCTVLNAPALRRRGIFEAALVSAYIGCKYNHAGISASDLDALFKSCDRQKLLAAGSQLPAAARSMCIVA